jgi:hypothetical protein
MAGSLTQSAVAHPHVRSHAWGLHVTVGFLQEDKCSYQINTGGGTWRSIPNPAGSTSCGCGTVKPPILCQGTTMTLTHHCSFCCTCF